MGDDNDTAHFILEVLGPRRAFAIPGMILLTILYVVIFIMGFVGNMLVVIVILKFRFMRENMTNLYLCNLAITDLLSVTAGMPLELYQFWHLYPWTLGHYACHVKTLIPETTACASVLTLVTLTVERFRAICVQSDSLRATQSSISPTESLHMKRVAIRNIIIIWIVSIVAAIPITVFSRINYLYMKDNPEPLMESAWCGMPFNTPDRIWENFMVMSTVCFFIIPLFVITLLYSLIGRTLRRANRMPNPDFQLTDQSSSRKIMKSRTIVIRLLVAIVIVFTICWMPFHAQRLLFLYVSLYGSWTDHLRNINHVLFLSAGVFYYLNSSLNPILYSVMSTRFRAAFSLYVSEFCSHSNVVVSGRGSTRGQSGFGPPKTHRSLNHSSEQSRTEAVRSAGVILGSGLTTAPTGITGTNTNVQWSKNAPFFQV